MTKAHQVFQAIAIGKGYKDMTMVNGRYVNSSMQTRWNYFFLGWQMRGVQ